MALASAGLLALASCSDGSGPSGDSRLSLLLTDAPGDVLAAVVTIEEIYLQGEDGKVVLRDDPVTTDLLTLANDTYLLVDDAPVPAGLYGQLRFVISGGYLEVEEEGGSAFYASSPDYDGLPPGAEVAGELRMPSFDQSGLKATVPEGLLEFDGDDRILLVDFDVAESFGHLAGNSGAWVMHPVVKATDVTFAASITAELRLGDGVTLPQVNGQDVTLAQARAVLEDSNGNQHPLDLADPELDGTFSATWGFLFPGDYEVSFLPPDGITFTTDPVSPVAVSLAEGESAVVAAVVTAAQ
jgi:hypothetical protein